LCIVLYNHGMNKAGYTTCLCLAIATIIIAVGCKKQPQQAAASDSNQAAKQQPTEPNIAAKPSVPQTGASNKPTLNQIIKRASTWDPAFTNWYGKEAPDFTVTDLKGQKHTLSEYKGKNVLLIFWATWCGPCIMEIPHLIELRKQISEDKLAMLAISYIDMRNTPEKIKGFVSARPEINYTVTATNPETMPKPYNLINSIPCSFFIAPDGKIKFATEGLVPLPDTKAIIEAEK
jgi:thiol-disulfide isomerase/thioredoxin